MILIWSVYNHQVWSVYNYQANGERHSLQVSLCLLVGNSHPPTPTHTNTHTHTHTHSHVQVLRSLSSYYCFTTVLLLFYYCFTTRGGTCIWGSSSQSLLPRTDRWRCTFRPALLLFYYYCFTTPVLLLLCSYRGPTGGSVHSDKSVPFWRKLLRKNVTLHERRIGHPWPPDVRPHHTLRGRSATNAPPPTIQHRRWLCVPVPRWGVGEASDRVNVYGPSHYCHELEREYR